MYPRVKRVADIIVAAIFLLLLTIPSVLIALIIKMDSKGPVFFRQQRFGKNKQPFTIYKFRTMATDAPADRPTNEFQNAESYITPVGAVMRKLSIDELPQLINVLRGDMSVIGPRPVILKETDLIEERDKYNANVHRPGITGWAQANGRDEVDVYEKARMDGEYTEKFSMMMDLRCLVKTVETIIFAKGYKEGSSQTTPDVYTFSSTESPATATAAASSYTSASTIQ